MAFYKFVSTFNYNLLTVTHSILQGLGYRLLFVSIACEDSIRPQGVMVVGACLQCRPPNWCFSECMHSAVMPWHRVYYPHNKEVKRPILSVRIELTSVSDCADAVQYALLNMEWTSEEDLYRGAIEIRKRGDSNTNPEYSKLFRDIVV